MCMWGLLHAKPSLVSHGLHVLGIAGLQPGRPSTAAGLPTEKEKKLLKGDDMFDVRTFFCDAHFLGVSHLPLFLACTVCCNALQLQTHEARPYRNQGLNDDESPAEAVLAKRL